MDKGEILEVVKDLTKSTSFDLSNTDDARMNALVTEAELHIFRDVPLAENSLYTSNLVPFQTADVHASLYHLPAGYQKVISVSQSGYQLNPMPPSTNSWTRRYPGRLGRLRLRLLCRRWGQIPWHCAVFARNSRIAILDIRTINKLWL